MSPLKQTQQLSPLIRPTPLASVLWLNLPCMREHTVYYKRPGSPQALSLLRRRGKQSILRITLVWQYCSVYTQCTDHLHVSAKYKPIS